MAYSPTTWNTNDVITKDKLNKIEQGVKTGTLLSGTDIDADKNWNGKNITNVGGISGPLLVCVAGESVRADSPLLRASDPSNTGWVKVFEAVVLTGHVGATNAYRIKYLWMMEKQGYGTGYSQIYVNGVVRGVKHSISSLVRDFEEISEDITGLKAGDKIQIYTSHPGGEGTAMLVKDIRICCEYASAGAQLTPGVSITM